MSSLLAASAACAAGDIAVTPPSSPAPAGFESVGEDRRAIQNVLAAYTKAVSTKDQATFETLLLSKTIAFSYVPDDTPAAQAGVANYDSFRRGVFEGPPFTQRFTNVRIEQDGNLASVTLVFINTQAQGESWGWKTLHLLKTAEGWKIASEFYTSHR